jgi:O-antigen/teichoic acid export membrane protein
LIVGWHLGRAELGFYSVGGRLAQTPGREIVAPLTATLFPALSLLRDSPERLQAGYVRAQTVVTAVALPVTVLVAVFASPLVLLLMGPRWLGAVPVIQAVASITAFESLGSLVGPLAMAKGQTDVLFRRDVLKLALRLPLILTGVVFGGFLGLLAGRALAGILGVLLDMTLVRSIARLSLFRQFWVNRRSLAATMAMAGTATLLQSAYPLPDEYAQQLLRLAVLGIASIAAFAGTTGLLWWISGLHDGPEREVLGLINGLQRKLRPRV